MKAEGEYEWATYHNGGGKEGAHAEPAVLYTPLGGGNEDDGFEDEWRRIFTEYGSRCEQYGGHWQGKRCVGIPHHRSQGPEVVRNICIFDWWNPVGWACGAVAAGKAAYEAASK